MYVVYRYPPCGGWYTSCMPPLPSGPILIHVNVDIVVPINSTVDALGATDLAGVLKVLHNYPGARSFVMNILSQHPDKPVLTTFNPDDGPEQLDHIEGHMFGAVIDFRVQGSQRREHPVTGETLDISPVLDEAPYRDGL